MHLKSFEVPICPNFSSFTRISISYNFQDQHMHSCSLGQTVQQPANSITIQRGYRHESRRTSSQYQINVFFLQLFNLLLAHPY